MSPKQIKQLRKRLDFTQQELADSVGCYQPTIARWENNVCAPRGVYLRTLKDLAARANRGNGQLSIAEERRMTVIMKLRKTELEFARVLGRGSVSEGVRIGLRVARRQKNYKAVD